MCNDIIICIRGLFHTILFIFGVGEIAKSCTIKRCERLPRRSNSGHCVYF